MADAIGPLFDAILDKISALALFAEVAPALNGGQLAVPSAEVWLDEDKEIVDLPSITRDLCYAVQVTVGYKENGSVQGGLHPLLDGLRTSFAGWLPDFIGVMPATVPLIKIVSSEDHGKTSYVMQIKIRVYIHTFREK